jgi:hypothetical protein
MPLLPGPDEPLYFTDSATAGNASWTTSRLLVGAVDLLTGPPKWNAAALDFLTRHRVRPSHIAGPAPEERNART